MTSTLPERRFWAFKVDHNTDRTKRDYILDLTIDECRDLKRFPAGLHQDSIGAFTWGYALHPRHC